MKFNHEYTSGYWRFGVTTSLMVPGHRFIWIDVGALGFGWNR